MTRRRDPYDFDKPEFPVKCGTLVGLCLVGLGMWIAIWAIWEYVR